MKLKLRNRDSGCVVTAVLVEKAFKKGSVVCGWHEVRSFSNAASILLIELQGSTVRRVRRRGGHEGACFFSLS